MHSVNKTNVQFPFNGFAGVIPEKIIAGFFKITRRKVRKIIQPDTPGQYFEFIKAKCRVDSYLIVAFYTKKNSADTDTDLEVIRVVVFSDKRLNQLEP